MKFKQNTKDTQMMTDEEKFIGSRDDKVKNYQVSVLQRKTNT